MTDAHVLAQNNYLSILEAIVDIIQYLVQSYTLICMKYCNKVGFDIVQCIVAALPTILPTDFGYVSRKVTVFNVVPQ